MLFFVCSSKTYCQDDLRSGLYFSSHEVIQDKRTSLNLTPNTYLKLANNFSIEFEANFRQDDGYYGYIFRLIGENGTNIDLVSNFASRESNFWLVYKEQILLSLKWDQLPDVSYGEWVKIKLNVDISSLQISLTIHGITKKTILPESFKTSLFHIFFGALRHQHFASMDVCPMSLRDIRINNNGSLYRHWKLSEHHNDKVYDEIQHAEAVVQNPVWIIDSHVKWKKEKKFQVDGLIGATHDKNNRRIFFVKEEEMYCVDIDNYTIDTIPYLHNRPYENRYARQVIYNGYFDQIWSYDFDTNAINVFDFDTQTWSESSTKPIHAQYTHQNRFISPIDSSLVSFSGYGHYRYSSDVHHYDQKSGIWEKFDRSDQIGPRYLSGATVISNDKALVFGGFGSQSGYQELSPKFYYDLFYFDLKDFSFQKIWTLSNPETQFVPCESLVYDESENCFYTLIYNSMQNKTHLRLARFDIHHGQFTIYNDSIPYSFLDTKSWASLFLDEKRSQLVAYATSGSQIEIHTMAYPPKLTKDILQNPPGKRLPAYIYWGIPLFLILFVIIYLLFRRKHPEPVCIQEESIELNETVLRQSVEQNKPSSLYLLGRFKIIDNLGNDITGSFAPTTTQLFLLILLTTIKNGKGITSPELKNILWSDKDDNSARNSKNVYMNKLRLLLKSFPELETVNEGGYQTMHGLDNIYCDYVRILTLIRLLDKNKVFNKNLLKELIDMTLTGKLLPFFQYEWLDPFQTDFTNSLIELILRYKENEEVRKDLPLLSKMADAILIHDNIDEDAVSMKCFALYNMGHKKQALAAFRKFESEYEALLAEKTKLVFENLIK